MISVFLLWHVRDEDDAETAKLVGIYSSRENATEAIQRKLAFPGFRDHPDGFSIDSYTLDEEAWSEGFGDD